MRLRRLAMQEVLSTLNTLISPVIAGGQAPLQLMRGYVNTLGIDLSKLRVIHITGTKGKGSTAAFTESVLRGMGLKTGLYTSPHLVDLRERICINRSPLPETEFVRHFWHVYNTLKASDSANMPMYFRLLTLLAFHVFIEEQVDVAILEVGIGGRLDATNVIPPPVAAGISVLDYDHQQILGHTLREIATEKGGIFKPGTLCIATQQTEEGQAALLKTTQALNQQLFLSPTLDAYNVEHLKLPGGRISLDTMRADFQRDNAGLAVALCSAFLSKWEGREFDSEDAKAFHKMSVEEWSNLQSQPVNFDSPIPSPLLALPERVVTSISSTKWAGRCQVVSLGKDWKTVDELEAEEEEEEEIARQQQQQNVACEGSSASSVAIPSKNSEKRGDLVMFLDGAHTPESLKACARWYVQESAIVTSSSPSSSKSFNVLVFNCTGDRDPVVLLKALLSPLESPDVILFVPNDNSKLGTAGGGAAANFAMQKRQVKAMLQVLKEKQAEGEGAKLTENEEDPSELEDIEALTSKGIDTSDGSKKTTLRIQPNIEASCRLIREFQSNSDRSVHVLVTGSVLLVGDVLKHLRPYW